MAIAAMMLAAALISLVQLMPEVSPEMKMAFSSVEPQRDNTTIPGGITSLTVTEGDGQVRLDWEAPDSGGAVDYYIVYRNGEDVAHCYTTSIVISGLTNGESYRFMVAAHGSAGMGPLTTAYEATPRAAVNLLAMLAPAATVGAVGVVIAREVRLDLLQRSSRPEERERPR